VTTTEFCKKCGSIMLPVRKGGKVYLQCANRHRKKIDAKDFRIRNEAKHEKVPVLEKAEENLPITHRLCPRCGRDKAYWWIEHTKSSEESPTQFFKCVKCNYTWREY